VKRVFGDELAEFQEVGTRWGFFQFLVESSTAGIRTSCQNFSRSSGISRSASFKPEAFRVIPQCSHNILPSSR